MNEQFEKAAKHFETIYKSCSDKEKLMLYALFNQATTGDVTGPAPSATSIVKSAKYKARKRLKGMTSEQAKKRYISELHRIDPTWNPTNDSSEVTNDLNKESALDAELTPAISKSKSLFGRRKSKNAQTSSSLSNSVKFEKVDEATFKKACEFAKTSGIFKDDTNRSVLYAYYKQATVGPCNKSAPVFSLRKKYSRWKTWCNLFDMSKDEAKARYVQRVKKLAGDSFDNGVTTSMNDMKKSNSVLTMKSEDLNGKQQYGDKDSDIIDALKEAKNNNGLTYLITGATGFVGKHLLEKLLKRNENSIIFCITREQSINKLKKLCYERYGIDNALRIIGISGDITKKNLGLNSSKIKAFKNNIDHFFHIAAMYDMRATTEQNELTNVTGTQYAIDVANSIKCKLFNHISSIAVAGDHDGLFFESSFNEGQTFDNAYLRTKFESEDIVRKSIKTPYRVYRPGIIIGSTKTGEADKIDGIYYLFKTLQQLRKWLPQAVTLPVIEGETIPIVPIDYCVDAMDELAHSKKKINNGQAFHLVDSSPPTLCELLNIFSKAAHGPSFSSKLSTVLLSLVPKNVWSAISNIPIIEQAPNGILSSFLDVPESVMNYAQWRADFDDADTREFLYGTGIQCPKLESYAWRCWDYYERNLDIRNVNRPLAIKYAVNGKTILITGSSDGIGAKLAERLAGNGATIILVARNMEKLKVVGDKIRKNGGIAYEYTCDLSKGDDCVKLYETVNKKHTVDILINNAGRSIRRSFEYQCDASRFHDFERTMQLNYFGSVRMICGFLPNMRKQKFGQIINISSISIPANQPRFGAYAASKSALDQLCKCIASEVHGDGVSFSTIYMPLVKTKMVQSKGNNYDHLNLLTTDEASMLIERAIVTKERSIKTIESKYISTASSLFPSLVESVLHRQYLLEPEANPKDQQPSKTAGGDKKQLKALSMLLSGAISQ